MSKRETIVKDIDIMPEELVDKFFAMWIDEKAIEEAEDEASFWEAVSDSENRRNLVRFDSFEDMLRDALED
jgi:hypothetical protein